ncbi:ester cyclase [Flavihumibacter stibioxidans]|uniref:Ester cyclase n=1 Tax=Flavihumibacter stibioxidans TaxID=1834163 RepID=A0ABR7M6B1_9BACT|nr:ester cyclase [Flavihumibacter stibioxidans]MBC6490558.1 hypothetical protein [Flavihumibacter stibioxidans]
MENYSLNAGIVRDFMDTIWNRREFNQLGRFLHPDFADLSLPPGLQPGWQGLQDWINTTSKSFEHYSVIEEQVTEANRSVIQLTMKMTHIGEWRGLPATGISLVARGFRYFRLESGLIIEHRALIDGTAIEKRLRETTL